MLRILHLSDLHFGKGHFFQQTRHDPGASSLAQAVWDCVEKEPPDWLLLSGDLFTEGDPGDYSLVRKAVGDLLATLRVSKERLLCVPGNHDITWDERQADSFTLYDDLMQDLGASDLRVEALPRVVVLPAGGHEPPVALLLLDSCRIEGKAMAGIGRVDDAQLRKLRALLDEQKVSAATHTLLAVMHHHLLPISPVETIVNPLDPKGPPIGKSSVTVDAVEVLQQMAKLGVVAVLHGHQHRPAILRHENLYSATGEIHVIAAGSCGAKPSPPADLTRQFFVYELGSGTLSIASYEQARDNGARFERQPRSWQIELAHAQPADKLVCFEDRFVRSYHVGKKATESGRADNSDLYFLLMSVVDCPKSREVIRELVQELPGSPAWQELGARYLKLVAMYDLLGHWDLLVRFRLDPRVNAQRFRRLLEGALVRSGMLPPEEKRRDSPFGAVKLVDVQQEGHSLGDLVYDRDRAAAEVEIWRVRLRTTPEYDRRRCQRGFVYVYLPEFQQDAMVRDLKAAVEAEPDARRIVESVCRSETALVFELFMTCAQSVQINQLNRALERVLPKYSVQKFTLLCYGYDEDEVDIDDRGSAPGLERKAG